ncbi:MAG: hypothetical protein H7281_05470 [Bacteriovorax sp.]|nr:hypothetical protein [Bacteriovorax sp.]
MMKIVIQLIFSLLILFHSTNLMAENCVVVIFGGSKSWISLLPGQATDISIDVASLITSQAKKTGCEILSFSNDSEKSFFEKLKTLKRSPYDKPGTNYHFAFADHGTSANAKNINDSYIITGLGEYSTYGKLMGALKEDLPKGAHITFQTNNCWPNMSEAIIANDLETHFDICGGSSTSRERMSWNMHELSTSKSGESVGAYGVVGLSFANDMKKNLSRFPSMSEFHYSAKKGDLGNQKRQAGLTTSLSFADLKLKEMKQKSLLNSQDIFETISGINWKNDKALDTFLANTDSQIKMQTDSMLSGMCTIKSAAPYDNFLKTFSALYQNLMNNNPDLLPAPYSKQSKSAKNYFLRNQKNLADLLSTNARERAIFVKKYEFYPKENYKNVEALWNKLISAQNEKLADYEFNLRLLQEGKTIQNFMNSANIKDKERFQKFLDCENRAML